MLVVSGDANPHFHCLDCCLLLVTSHPSLCHLVRLLSPPFHCRSLCQDHQDLPCCPIWPSLLCPLLTPTLAGTDIFLLPQPLDNTQSWFSLYIKDQSFLVIHSGPSLLERPRLVLGPLFFTFSLGHFVQYHPNADVSWIYYSRLAL